MESRKIDLQKAFEQNLKFISATEINVETVEKQFVKTNNRFYLTVGKIDCPTGRIVVSDPLCYLQAGKYAPMLDVTIPVGIYPVEVAICRNEHVGIRMCTVRLKITESKAVKYNLAYPTKDTAIAVTKEKVMAGFPVEAGMISFCDEKVTSLPKVLRVLLSASAGSTPPNEINESVRATVSILFNAFIIYILLPYFKFTL